MTASLGPGRLTPLGTRRAVAGWLLALLGPGTVTAVLAPLQGRPAPGFAAMWLLALTVGCALVGGLWPAVACAFLSTALLNYFFTAPLHTFAIADAANIVALALFVAVAVGVASVVDHAARRTVQAEEARQEADTLGMLNQTLLGSEQTVLTVLELVRDTFAMRSAALLQREPAAGWRVVASVGAEPPVDPDAADAQAEASPSLRLVLGGRALSARDLRVLSAFATHLSVVLEREEIARREAAAREVEAGDRLRTALLAAVSHDLRTPLASIKAAVSTLETPGIRLTDTDRRDLLAAIEHSTDSLRSIVDNLLDMSRLQAGALSLDLQDVGLDDVLSRAVGSVVDPAEVDIDVPPGLPDVTVDLGLLDRVVANLVQNAVRHSPAGSRARLVAAAHGDRVRLSVVDHGPGVPDALKPKLFEPFQRLDDRHTALGVGLGLAVAKGLTEAQGGRLVAEDTPGGGLTMVVDLPGAPVATAAEPEGA
jgi:two-component system sensor histidine kinase KdpD